MVLFLNIALAAAVLFPAAAVPQELLDGVAAIVGDEIVLRSEVLNNAQYWAFQMGVNPVTQAKEFDKIKEQVLQSLINDKVLLVKAKEDTITVDDQKVETELENRVESLVRQAGSVERLEAQFGTPLKKFKRDKFDEVKRMMIIKELEGKKFRGMQVSRNEVQAFFRTVKDSLPERKPMVKLRHILFQIKPGAASRKKAMDGIRSIQERLNSGESFESLASLFSEDAGTASRGGNLGFVEKGTLFPAFEAAAFELNPGEVSGPVETPLGFHIIKLEEKRGEQALIKHILLRLRSGEADGDETYQRLLEIRNRVLAGEDFKTLAASVSEDSSSRSSGGDLGWLPLEDLQIEAFKNAVDSLQKGDLSMPIQTPYGYHLILMEDKQPARRYTLEDDYDEFKNKAFEAKMQKLRDQWVRELKKGIYVEIKEDML